MQQLAFLLLVFLAFAPALGLVPCDQRTACPDDATCCRLPGGSWGCCPFRLGVCCADHLHCCPQSTRCDAQGAYCAHADGRRVPIHRKKQALALSENSESSESSEEQNPVQERPRIHTHRPGQNPVTYANNSVTCADKKTTCPQGTTCCQLGESTYGCCPLPNAVCCEDQIHCCPENTQCDVAEGRCTDGKGLSTPWYSKLRGQQIKHKSGIEMDSAIRSCSGDAGGSCRSNEKCCGPLHCCPFADGVCCGADPFTARPTCCPRGYECSRSGGNCIVPDDSVIVETASFLMGSRFAETMEGRESTVCPDDSECPSNNTCCPNPKGNGFLCCPVKSASCCGRSCCPRGYHCSANGNCERALFTGYF